MASHNDSGGEAVVCEVGRATSSASLMGLRQATISRIENGNPAATMKTILAVLAALDLELRIVPRSKGNAAAIEDIF